MTTEPTGYINNALSIDRLCIAFAYHTDNRTILNHDEKIKEFGE